MAYYSTTPYSNSDYGESNFNSYALNYDYYSQNPPFISHNTYNYNYNYNNQPYYYYGYDPIPTPNYSVHQSYPQTISYSAPKSFQYDPNYGMTQLVISYSKIQEGFNEPAFDDYDPTPYGGGYDIAETYGKPLPPSNEICYPPFGSNSITPKFDAVPAGSILPLPTIDEGIDDEKEKEKEKEKAIIIKPQNESARQVTDEMPHSQDTSKDQPNDALDLVEPNESDEESEESEHDHYSGSGDYGSEYEKQVHVPQYPSGYGLESLDICESLFGHWPCLSRMKKNREEEQHCCRGNNCCYQENMWKGTVADYLFGNPDPYGGSSSYGGGGGELVYGYERHYPSTPQEQYLQIEYTADESW